MNSEILSQLKFPRIMGILNLTEDSFSDGADFLEEDKATRHALKLIDDGAQILDIGAESTRPGSKAVPPQLQWQRIEPVLKNIRSERPGLTISIDTQSSFVARKAIASGADIINDVSAMKFDPDMIFAVAEHPQVKVILMHMQGNPETMHLAPTYTDVISEVYAFLQERLEYAENNGIDKSRIILDPGIGFGKNLNHNLKILRSLSHFSSLGCKLLLGTSRKRFIEQISGGDVQHRVGGSLATTMLACLFSIDIIRVHDVFEHHQFIKTLQAVAGAS
jgi:dihydropteroate synthase